MPEDNPQNQTLTPAVVTKKSKRTLILLIILVISIVVLGGIIVYVNIYNPNKNYLGTNQGRSKVATPSSTKSPTEVKTQGLSFIYFKNTSNSVEPGGGYNTIYQKEIWLYSDGKTQKLVGSGFYFDEELSKDGKKLYYISGEVVPNKGSTGTTIKQLNIETNETKTLASGVTINQEAPWQTSYSDISLSPDQNTLAFIQDGVWLLNLTTFKAEKFLNSTYYSEETMVNGHGYQEINWSPSGEYLRAEWGGYEDLGYEVIKISDKSITPLYDGHPAAFDLVTMRDDNKLIFSDTDGDILEKERTNLDSGQKIFTANIVANYGVGNTQQHTYKNFAVYSAKLNTLFFGRDSLTGYNDKNPIWKTDVAAYDYATKQVKSLTEKLNINDYSMFEDLQISKNSDYLVFSTDEESKSQKSDIWIIDIKNGTINFVLDDSSKPETGY
ncbi:MAG TPA: hypothetical protein VLE47_03835 [Candidatus Saccharimonadales bacterium]|nr:hypothetical protein [Candidatus Saccharimonadales bacterium]